jgi:hypothetical protein
LGRVSLVSAKGEMENLMTEISWLLMNITGAADRSYIHMECFRKDSGFFSLIDILLNEKNPMAMQNALCALSNFMDDP